MLMTEIIVVYSLCFPVHAISFRIHNNYLYPHIIVYNICSSHAHTNFVHAIADTRTKVIFACSNKKGFTYLFHKIL
jgi:hypothetical protein